MDYVRTPDERFLNLPGYPFEPNYINVDCKDGTTLRMLDLNNVTLFCQDWGGLIGLRVVADN